MNFFQNIGKTKRQEHRIVLTPVSGGVIPLTSVDDAVFSAGLLGDGCGILPSNEVITSPFRGTVMQIAETNHALGLVSDDGIELLIHVGIDTVDMAGDGFLPHVKHGDTIVPNQPLLSFSKHKIEATNHPTTVIVVVTNSDELGPITHCQSTSVKHGEPLFAL